MSEILITGREAVNILRVSSAKFLQLQDKGRVVPILRKEGVFYNLLELRKADFKTRTQPSDFPEDEYTTATKAMEIIGVSRRTFYNRVNAGLIKLHKRNSGSYVKLTDLYANDDLF